MTITNVMRLLKQANIPFETSEYEVDESDLSGVHAAQMLGIDPDCMFKTLVAKGEKKGVYVFCIPVAEELDLKKCAQAAGEKIVTQQNSGQKEKQKYVTGKKHDDPQKWNNSEAIMSLFGNNVKPACR